MQKGESEFNPTPDASLRSLQSLQALVPPTMFNLVRQPRDPAGNASRYPSHFGKPKSEMRGRDSCVRICLHCDYIGYCGAMVILQMKRRQVSVPSNPLIIKYDIRHSRRSDVLTSYAAPRSPSRISGRTPGWGWPLQLLCAPPRRSSHRAAFAGS